MALGAVTRPTPIPDFTNGNKRQRVRDIVITAGANYTTGGEIITPAAVGLNRRIEQVSGTGAARLTTDGSTSIPISISYLANGTVKLQGYVAATGAEQTAAANLSTFSTRLTFVGV